MAQTITRRDICRLLLDPRIKYSNRQIAELAGMSPTTIGKYRSLLAVHQVSTLAELEAVPASQLDEILQTQKYGAKKDFMEPDWDAMFEDHQTRGCTLALLY